MYFVLQVLLVYRLRMGVWSQHFWAFLQLSDHVLRLPVLLLILVVVAPFFVVEYQLSFAEYSTKSNKLN